MAENLKNCYQSWLIPLFLTLAGLVVSLYSALSHYKNYTDPQYSSFCAITRAINCDTVAQSPWSIFMGLPIAWWGVLFFLFLLCILAVERHEIQQSSLLLFFIILLATIASIGLATLSIFKIHSLCVLCLSVYAIIFMLTFFFWLSSRKQKDNICQPQLKKWGQVKRSYTYAISIFLIGTVCTYLFLPRYWVEPFSSETTSIQQGLTQDGHPWIGAEKPELTIIQFSDYQCFQCAKMQSFLRALVALHPNTLRLEHRNYPMDQAVNPEIVQQPFHVGSGELAKIAIIASLHNKFWEMNELLYTSIRTKEGKLSLQNLAAKTGLNLKELTAALTDSNIQEILRRDIWRGMKLGIIGTPAFVIEGNVYQGYIPERVLNKIANLSKNK